MHALKAFMAAAALALASSAAAQPVCYDPLKPMLRAELYFGRDIGGRVHVSEREWTRFLAHEITPRFPDGLTVLDGKGQWRNGGTIVREPSKIVVIVAADGEATRIRLKEVMQTYIDHFHQKSVGLVTQTVCAAF